MTLYETMFARRSVRKYDMTPLDPATLSQIETFLSETRQLEGQNAKFKIVSANEANDPHAPHYILAYCDAGDGAYVNVGYVLEKADLYLQSIGLGSLWLGMAKPSEDKRDFCIMLAFGKTDVPLRKGASDFSRLPIGEISSADNPIANAARLAPSAVNSQPWRLHFEDGRILVRYAGRGLMKLMLKKKLNKIDMGIITRFLVTALRNDGKNISAIRPSSDAQGFFVEIRYA